MGYLVMYSKSASHQNFGDDDTDDECAVHPGTWISSPPGAGKTALICNYLELKNEHSIGPQNELSQLNDSITLNAYGENSEFVNIDGIIKTLHFLVFFDKVSEVRY